MAYTEPGHMTMNEAQLAEGGNLPTLGAEEAAEQRDGGKPTIGRNTGLNQFLGEVERKNGGPGMPC